MESGIFYTIYVVRCPREMCRKRPTHFCVKMISLICTFIRVPTGTLGDITNKVLVHIAVSFNSTTNVRGESLVYRRACTRPSSSRWSAFKVLSASQRCPVGNRRFPPRTRRRAVYKHSFSLANRLWSGQFNHLDRTVLRHCLTVDIAR